MEYNVEYFLNKFSKIPNDRWCKADLGSDGKHCALGHCGVTDGDIDIIGNIDNEEGSALSNVLKNVSPYESPYEIVFQINDCDGENPKTNIITALSLARDKELSEANLKEASKIVSENKIELV